MAFALLLVGKTNFLLLVTLKLALFVFGTHIKNYDYTTAYKKNTKSIKCISVKCAYQRTRTYIHTYPYVCFKIKQQNKAKEYLECKENYNFPTGKYVGYLQIKVHT